MKPIKSLVPVSIWIMRIGLLLFAYNEYFSRFSKFQLSKVEFYVATLFLVASAIIFITGIVKKTTLTVASGFVITLISIYNIINIMDGGLDSILILNLLIVGIAVYFLSDPR